MQTAENLGYEDRAFSGRGLLKTYVTGETEVHALRGVDFDIRKGDILVLLDPSGVGMG